MSNVTDINNGLVFREDFRDEFSVRKNGGIPTNVVFEDNKAVFDGTGIINYKEFSKLSYCTLRCILRNYSSGDYIIAGLQDLIGTRYNFLLRVSNNKYWIYVTGSNGSQYVNGNTDANQNDECIISYSNGFIVFYVNGILQFQSTYLPSGNIGGENLKLCIGGDVDQSTRLLVGEISLVEIYNRALSAEEVYNLYNNTQVPKDNILFDLTSQNGYIEDRTGNQTLSSSNVELKKLGHIYNMQYNGSDSYLDTGSNFIGTKAVTVCCWINPRSMGEGNNGEIVSNSIFRFAVAFNGLQLRSDGTTISTSGTDSIKLNSYNFLAVTRNIYGTVNFFIGTNTTPPIQTGVADQDSGTPVVGTANVFIGNNSATSRTFDGIIGPLTIFEGILTLNEITKYWSDTKKLLR